MDVELFHVGRGTGASLILLHGNGESSEYFCHQIDGLSDAFRVIAPDTRGHGRSPRGSAPFTISRFADDLYGFLSRLGIKKAHILGFSDGGNIVALFALRHPEMVDKLVLCGANLDASGVKPGVQLPIELGYRFYKLLSRVSLRALHKAELLSLMVDSPNIPAAALSAIQAKNLVIAGTRDMIKDSHTRLIADSIPGARLVILEGDHFIAYKQPAAFNAAVRGFLCDG